MFVNKLCFPFFVLSIVVSGCAHHASINDVQTKAAKPSAIDLSFREFYKLPIGTRGLEPTSKLLSLKDKRVHIQGFMVKEEEPTAGIFMVTSLPVNIPEKEDGPSDDLPGATVFVHMPSEDAEKTLAYRDGMWDLVGTLQLGAKEESNGRISYVRLLLDQDLSTETTESKSLTTSR